ncbi:M81 family metallopeptidase [Halomontanus rarus]|uniref:M81 family metallopeptidase n=1 Tax=Halomontanus rarus TaxID=3034020 RepID=UPI0023E8ACA0|nr:M81 family metallopeptidase [Halovivax sp. TS33]
MNVAVGTASHETNTFTEERTTLEEFTTATDEALFDEFPGGRSLNGIVDVLEANDEYTVVPTIGASSIPSGVVEPAAFEWIRDGIVSRIEAVADDLDGVCLDLHGSMFVADEPDAEGALLAAVRDVVGDEVPIVGALDMHATLSEAAIENADALVGYRTAPHTDVYETGRRAAHVLKTALEDGVELEMERITLPILIAGEQSETEAQPMRDLMGLLDETERRDGLLSTSYFLGFPWADNPHAGVSAIAVGDADHVQAVRETSVELAEAFWDRHEEFGFSTEAHRLDTVLDIAASTSKTPVVVGDSGDIPGAGASQDVMNTLEEMVARDDLGRAVFAIVVDERSVARCFEAGGDQLVDLDIGRVVPDGRPYSATVRVQNVRTATDFRGDVRIVHGTVDGVHILLADRKTNLHRSVSFLESFGLGPDDAETIVLKSGYLSPDWKNVAGYRMLALTNGDTNQRLDEMEYTAVPRPMFPLDDPDWEPNS